MQEWHYYSDSWDARSTGEYGWRKTNIQPLESVLSKTSTHVASGACGKLCVKGLWPIPPELVKLNPIRDAGAFGYQKKEHAESWYVPMNGRVFLLIRHNGRTRNLVMEMEYRLYQPYSWIPGYPQGKVWDWITIQSIEGY
jgi:hypothetical protein